MLVEENEVFYTRGGNGFLSRLPNHGYAWHVFTSLQLRFQPYNAIQTLGQLWCEDSYHAR